MDTPGCWLAGKRLVAVDGTCLDLADTASNDEHFGRPGVNKGERSAFPQARVVALAECGTPAIIDAEIGPYTTSEAALSAALIGRLVAGMLCLADRGFYSFTAWQAAAATGADLLWRVKENLKLEPVQDLDDGSYLAEVFDSKADRRREHPARVRVIETAFDELKTHQRGPRAVLRSKSPELVLQEIFGHLCCHYSLRALMFDAAEHASHDPDRISFVAALRISRRAIAQQGAFPPSHP